MILAPVFRWIAHLSFVRQKFLLETVIFAGDEEGQNNKVSWMRDHKLKIYYGDADADIAAARELNIRGIRVLRASNSSYQPLPKAGQFGEEVVINSEY